MRKHSELTDEESQNTATDDDEFVHRNWMTDRRIAGVICLIPGLLMIACAVPLVDFSSFNSLIVGRVLDPNSVWHEGNYIEYDYLSFAAIRYNLLTILYIGGALLSAWCLKIVFKLAARKNC